MLQEAIRSGIVEKLSNIVGNNYVSKNQADLYIHSYDMTQAEPSFPDILVLPKTVEEVQQIIRLANKEKIAVTPYVAGGNVGGTAIPLEGGIILDLKRMDRIIKVNDIDMYAVVEPGVTFGHLKAYLETNHPDLIYTYAFSPPSTGIITNALLQGLDNLSFRYGAASAWVSGLEVVLGTGELVKIGSCAVSDSWHALVPMPETAGLFLGWQGTTGIITKMSVSLWPKVNHTASLNFQLKNAEDTYRLIRALAKSRVPDDVISNSFALGKVSMRAMKGEKASIYPAPEKKSGEPELTVSVEISGNTEEELNAKNHVIEKIVKEDLKDIKVNFPVAMPSGRAGFPMQALPVLSGGGGLTWVGSYGPLSRWAETCEKGCLLQDKYDICRSSYTRVLNEGHFVGLRWMLPFDKSDPETVRRVKALTDEQLDLVIKMGFVPYKTPVWAVRKLEEHVSPEWLKLHRGVKKLCDPRNILNPGRWGKPA
jgi:FAD/FMN-containing dehydrogenase